MSVMISAARPLSRRALEGKGMTPEEELELLIREQEADDTHVVRRPQNEVSTHCPAPNGSGDIGDYIGIDENGEVVSFLPRSAEPFAPSFIHATFDAYNNQRCRCLKCKAFMREYRARKRAES